MQMIVRALLQKTKATSLGAVEELIRDARLSLMGVVEVQIARGDWTCWRMGWVVVLFRVLE
jgi:hypothetical protein